MANIFDSIPDEGGVAVAEQPNVFDSIPVSENVFDSIPADQPKLGSLPFMQNAEPSGLAGFEATMAARQNEDLSEFPLRKADLTSPVGTPTLTTFGQEGESITHAMPPESRIEEVVRQKTVTPEQRAEVASRMDAGQQISQKYRAMREQAAGNPLKVSEIQTMEKEELRSVGIEPLHDAGIDEALTKPILEFPQVSKQDLMTLGLPENVSKLAAGTQQGVVQAANFMTSPLGIATMGMGSMSLATRQLISTGFAVDMARHAPEQFAEMGRALGEGDTEGAARAMTGAALTMYFIKGSLEHGGVTDAVEATVRPKAFVTRELSKQLETSPRVNQPNGAREMAQGAPMDAPATRQDIADLKALLENGNRFKGNQVAETPIIKASETDSNFIVNKETGTTTFEKPKEILTEQQNAGEQRIEGEQPSPKTAPESKTGTVKLMSDAKAIIGESELRRRANALMNDARLPESAKAEVAGRPLEAIATETAARLTVENRWREPVPLSAPDKIPTSASTPGQGALATEKPKATASQVLVSPEKDQRPAKSSANDYVPAIRTASGIIKGNRGETHNEIIERQPQAWQIENRPTLTDANRGFAKGEEFHTREQVAEALGEKLPMQSEKLRQLQSAKDQKESDGKQGELPEGKGLSDFSKGPGASNPSDVGATGAAEQSGVRIAEFINEGSKPDIRVKPDIAESDLRSSDSAVEARWRAAKLSKVGIFERGRQALVAAKNSFTRHFHLLNPKTDGAVSNILRVHESDLNTAKYQASQVIRGITAQLAPKKYDVFSRIVILRDLVNYSDKYLRDSEALTFGYKSIDAIKSDLKKFEVVSDKYPDIKDAIKRRDEFMDALRQDMVERGSLPEAVKDFGAYFHHQVLEHMALKNTLPASANDVRVKTKGWQKARVGSEKDFNTSYLESEFEVISQSFAQMAAQDTLKRIQAVADIAPDLKAAAKGTERDWRSLLPKDYTLWQPEKGNHFYWANSLTERTLDSFFRGERSLTPADLQEVMAVGSKREQWAIPKRLAQTLDNFGKQQDHAAEKFIGAGMAQWKRWTLFNPMRNLIYQLNNLSGDFDISFAVDPKIIKHAPRAAGELRRFVLQKKAGDAEMNTLIKQGVIDSGFSVQELPDLKGQQFFQALEGGSPNLIDRYWNTVLDYNRWREGVLRLAAYRRAMEKLDARETFYWTSKKSEIDGMRKDPNITKEELASKLSREAIGDYGNISHAGEWVRSKAIPFYSWMEINAPRYVRLFQNVKNEPGAAGRGALVIGKKTAVLTAKAAAFYALANIWNNTFFSEEEAELGDTRKQFHIILGRREDGSVITMRLQGAFSDALDWFGAGNVVEDVKQIKEGRASIGDVATEMAKAPVNRVVNAAFPMQKTAAEAVLGRSLYPDVFNPRVIRDRAGHVAKLFSVGTIYNYLTKKPQRPGTWNPLSLVTYSTDAGEAAYYAAKSITSDWIEKNGREQPVALPTLRGNALYYYKQSIKYKDDKLAKYWLDKYMGLGGTTKGMKQSIGSISPYAGIAKKDLATFKRSMSPEEKEIIDKAMEWYERTYK